MNENDYLDSKILEDMLPLDVHRVELVNHHPDDGTIDDTGLFDEIYLHTDKGLVTFSATEAITRAGVPTCLFYIPPDKIGEISLALMGEMADLIHATATRARSGKQSAA